MKRLIAILSVLAPLCFAQLPQSSTTTDQPASVQMVNGVGPGYRPTKGTGLTLNLSKGGTQCVDKWIDYAGGTLSLTDNTTSWVYIDPAQDCIPVASTTEPGQGVCRNSKVVTASGAISTITDQRVAGCAISKLQVNGSSGGTGGSGGGANATGSNLIEGCGVAYTSGLSFVVSRCKYLIAGTQYEACIPTDSTPIPCTITLDAADGSNDRIDVIAVTSSATAVKITGTAAGSPAEPTIDPATQLRLTAVTVPTGSSTPAGITLTDLYQENTEDPCAVSSNLACASTSNPFAGTKDIEATSAVATNNFTLTKASGTRDLSTFTSLIMQLRSKAAWPNAKSLGCQFYNASTPVGSLVAIRSGLLGFQSNITGSYQQIAIPITSFAAGSTAVNKLKCTITGGGGSMGFYADSIQLQAGAGGISTNGVACSQMPSLTGDVTNGGGASCITAIANNAVTTVKITDANVTNAKLANSSITVSTTAPITGGASVSLGGTVTVACPTCGTGSGNVTHTGTLTSPKIVIGNGTADITSIGTPTACSAGSYARGIDANGDSTGCTVAGTGTVTGSSLTSGQLITGAGSSAIQTGNLSGDVTTSGGTATTVVNLPDGVTQAGSILTTNIAAPTSPASGKVKLFTDSTDLRLHDKNSAGAIGTTVVADTGASNNFLTAISAAGAISKAQPSFSNISGTAAVTQGGTGLTAVAADQLFTGTASNTFTAKTVPDCTDTTGNHLNYTQSTHAWSCGTSSASGTASPFTGLYPNDGSTGTTVNRVAKLTGNNAVIATTSDATNPIIGIVSSGAGTTGNATVCFHGPCSCDFDGATTAGHLVRLSTTTNGKCHDKGAAGNDRIDTNYDFGIVESTNGGAGTYSVDMGGIGQSGFNSNGYTIPLYQGNSMIPMPSAMTASAAGVNSATINIESGSTLKFYGSGGSNGVGIQNDGTDLNFNGNAGTSRFKFTTAIYFTVKSDGGGSWDIDARQGSVHNYTMSADLATITFSGFPNGTPFWLLLCQNGTGGFTPTWPSAVKNPGSMPAGANACLYQSLLYYDSTHIWVTGSGTY